MLYQLSYGEIIFRSLLAPGTLPTKVGMLYQLSYGEF